MSKRAKNCLVVIGAQSVCVAVGLWMHNRSVVASANDELRQDIWRDLEATARDLRGELRNIAPAAGEPVSGEQQQVAALLGTVHPSVGRAVLADSDWHFLFTPASSGPATDVLTDSAPVPGHRIDFRPISTTSMGVTTGSRGTLTLPDGEYIASAYPVGEGQAYVIVYHSLADIEARVAALLSSMFGISAVTLLWTCALLGIGVYLIMARFHDDIDTKQASTSSETLRQIQSLVRTRNAVIFGLAKLTDSRDPETGDHLERMSEYSTLLATALHDHPKFARQVTPAFIRLIGISSALHDIGKVGVEDRILLKPGPLTDKEREAMQKHPIIGAECLQKIEQRLGGSNFLQMAREIAMAHHERWDGNGYPHRLSGEEIPLAARIVAVADVYDALSTRRVYKDAILHDRCVDIIRSQAGKRLDPNLVEVWLTLEEEFAEIARRHALADPDDTTHDLVDPGLPPVPETADESSVSSADAVACGSHRG